MPTIVTVHQPAQIREVVCLAAEIWTEHYVPIVGQAQIDYMLGAFQSEASITDQLASGYAYFLVLAEGRSIGYMAIVQEPDASHMLLSKFYLRKAERGKGIGRQMLQFVEQRCAERQVRTLWLTVNKNNAATIESYIRMGFKNTGPVVQDIGAGFVMDDYRMEKVLAADISS